MEDSIEIVQDRYDADFGRARVRTADRRLPQALPGVYCPPSGAGLESDDYQWLIEDGFFSGRTVWYREEVPVATNLFPPVDLTPVELRGTRPSTVATSAPTVFDKPPSRFEDRCTFLHSSARLLKMANATAERIGSSRSARARVGQRGDSRPSTTPSQPKAMQVPKVPPAPQLLAYLQNGPKEAVVGLDSVPVLKGTNKYDSKEVAKNYTRRLYGENSMMNVLSDSQFLISKTKAIPVQHITTCLYRNDRKYGDIFDQKALKRDKKRREQGEMLRCNSSYGEKLSAAVDRMHHHHAATSSSHPVATASRAAVAAPSSPTKSNLSLPLLDQAVIAEASQGPLSARASKKPSVFEPCESLDLTNIRASFIGDSPVMKALRSVQLAEGVDGVVRRSISPPARDQSYSIQTVSTLRAPASSSVGFTYTASNKLETVHLQSEQLKPRPQSAGSVQSMTSQQQYQHSYNAKTHLLDMISHQQAYHKRKSHPRKDLNALTCPAISERESALEREALVDIFETCGGMNWIRNDHWCSDKPVKQWYGVEVTVEGYVFEINLPANNLHGAFPDMISHLKHLETVFLDNNRLYGSLPDYALQKCHHLQILSVQHNALAGEIGFNNFTNLSKIREIWLTDNQFSGKLQEGVCKLTALTHLSLAKNQLEGSIPSQMGKLHNLLYLAMGENKLSGGIPQSLIALHQLQTLSLHNNQLTGKVPDWLFALTSLEDVFLFHNAFEDQEAAMRPMG